MSRALCVCGELKSQDDRPQNKLEALLVSVGETLNETLYARTHSVVYASATP